jgi:hypothetical protein
MAAPALPDPVVTGLIGPLQLDVNRSGQIFVGQAFAGVLSKVRSDGTLRTVVRRQGEIAGVAVRRGHVAFTHTKYAGEGPATSSTLKVRRPNGSVRTVARLLAFEQRRNPDRFRRYGFAGLSDACAARVPNTDPGQGKPYRGIVESHAYAVANAPGGGWYVADAGGNTVLKVRRDGHVRSVFVAAPLPLRITAAMARVAEYPACVVGKTYRFEGVPTDVEVSQSGRLFVTLLPGGPEDPSFGARGALVRVNAETGQTKVVARGFAGATNLALASNNRVFVSELFGGKVSVVNRVSGRVRTAVEAPLPAAVEYRNGRLVLAYNVFNQETGGSISVMRR